MARLNQWAFRNQILNGPNVRVRKIEGPFALPPLRGDNFLTMGRTGRLFVPKIHDERTIKLEIIVRDMPYGVTPGIFDWLATQAANRTQGPLANILDSGTRTGQAECIAWSPVDMGVAGLVFYGVAEFQLADPWLYGPTVSGSVVPNAGISIYSTATNAVNVGSRTTYALTFSAGTVISGQPIIVCHSSFAAAGTVTSIADTFGGHYTYVKVDGNATSSDSEIWIGTGGTGTSGVITVTCTSGIVGGFAMALQGASTSAGLGAVDVHGNASLPAYASPSLTLTPTASGELFIATLMDDGASVNYPANAYQWTPFGRSGTPTEAMEAAVLNPTSGVASTMTFVAYGSTVSGICGAIVKGSGAPVTLNLTNPGTATVEKLTIDILGPFTTPTISNATTGTSLTISTVVGSTKHLIVDTGAFTALNDGANVIGSVTHSGAVPFLTLAPGLNVLQVSGGAATGSTLVTVSFLPAYA